MMNRIKLVNYIAAFAAVVGFAHLFVSAQIATGGSYALEQTVIAGGGGSSGGGFYAVESTTGQATLGPNQSGGTYGLKGGFWNAVASPAAATVSVSGRVIRNGGGGITNARVTLSGGSLTTPRVTLTGRYGAFRFDDVPSGQSYTVTVGSRRFSFNQPSQTIFVMDNVTDILFQAA